MTIVRWDSLRDMAAHQERSRMLEGFYGRPEERGGKDLHHHVDARSQNGVRTRSLIWLRRAGVVLPWPATVRRQFEAPCSSDATAR
jgi:hypothetical protein